MSGELKNDHIQNVSPSFLSEWGEKERLFCLSHRTSSVRSLALQASKYPDINMPFALNQIAGWQTACRKLPTWAGKEGIVYPPHLSMEQCSSEQTALYKEKLAKRLAQAYIDNEANKTEEDGVSADLTASSFVDLTGGFGVDFSFMGRNFVSTYVEQQPHLCEIAKNNFPLLGLERTTIVNADGVEYLHQLDFSTIIYLDPARRDSHGGKTVFIGDCTPNLIELKDELIGKSGYTIVKLSPMLDWHKAVEELNAEADIVREVHVVSVKNECRELLFVLGKGSTALRLYCINDAECLVVDAESGLRESVCSEIKPGQFLYEPNASVMKAGCFGELSVRYNAKAVSQNSHLFVSDGFIEDFPGRKFTIKTVSSFNKKELKQALSGIKAANIATRNFPVSVAELRKRLKLKDGGSCYVFATTDAKGEHLLLICEK